MPNGPMKSLPEASVPGDYYCDLLEVGCAFRSKRVLTPRCPAFRIACAKRLWLSIYSLMSTVSACLGKN